MAHDEVSIHIDKVQYKSPSPTTGAALYVLGKVAAGYDLFEEVPGPGDDNPIANDAAVVSLKNGTHLYTAKQTLNPGHEPSDS